MLKSLLLFSLVAASAFLLKIATNKISDKRAEVVEEDIEVKFQPRKRRTPASVESNYKNQNSKQKVAFFRPEMSESERRNPGFQGGAVPENGDGESIEVSDSPEVQGTDYNEEVSAGDDAAINSSSQGKSKRPREESKNSNSARNSNSSSKSGNTGRSIGAGVPLKPTVVTTPTTTQTPATNSGAGTAPSVISCSSNYGGGAYSNPLSISLTCTSASDIKYCVSAGVCCDPESSGTTYSSNIVVGSTDGTYCLSFVGTDNSGNSSVVVSNSFVISSALPDLDATHDKIFYQTTELAGVSHIASDDFGKINFGVGIVNLKTHDPGPSGLNLACEDIVTNYVSLMTPAPVVVLNFFDTSGTLVSSQLDVPLLLSHLSYGENYITTYITDHHNAVPLYSCSTTKVNLEDFEYFQSSITHGDAGTDSVREFAGGFSPYGFFEEEAVVSRGPAGESSQTLAGQSLETGLFGVFY